MFSTVAGAEKTARRRMPRFLIDYKYKGGGAGWTNRENQRAFGDVLFRRRAALTHRGPPSLATTVLGSPISMPVIIAPTGMTRLDHPDGDVAMARAAGAAGTMCAFSHFAGHTIEELAAAGSGRKWQQLYWSMGRAGAEDVMERAARSGYAALILTVDLPWAPSLAFDMPRRNLRTAVTFAPQVLPHPRWLLRFARGLHLDPTEALQPLAGTLGPSMSPSWEEIRWVRDRWKGSLVIKGIQLPDDARRAADCGADAIVVSNHGGQFLDGAPSTISMLPGIVAAVGGSVEVLMDGGVRQGSDVARALALGARAVLVGRAPLFGLAVAGEAGVTRILEILRSELAFCLGVLGCESVQDLDASYVRVPMDWMAR